jgi:hypothetical protein
LMSELTPEPDPTDDECKKNKIIKLTSK